HRSMHLHLLGRSPASTDPSWRWGESPRFPDFADRLTWSVNYTRLNQEECNAVVRRVEALLTSRYHMSSAHIAPWAPCETCDYPTSRRGERDAFLCDECGPR
ncbi:MAG: hypothetical protein ABI679_16490, partial [Gemmatimonadota bacterium]